MSLRWKSIKRFVPLLSKGRFVKFTLTFLTLSFFLFAGGRCLGGMATSKTTLSQAPDFFDNPSNTAKLENSTVWFINKYNMGQCSGFFISPSLILTNRHCVLLTSFVPEQAQESEIRLRDYNFVTLGEYKRILSGSKGKFEDFFSEKSIARVVYYPTEPDLDLVMLFVMDKNNFSKTWLKFAPEVPRLREKVYSCALPGGMPWILEDGKISRKMTYGGSGVMTLFVQIPIAHGSSGSPLVNGSGELVGMAMAMNETGGIGLYISAKSIERGIEQYVVGKAAAIAVQNKAKDDDSITFPAITNKK
jgi:S1-C subfamily serine protease